MSANQDPHLQIKAAPKSQAGFRRALLTAAAFVTMGVGAFAGGHVMSSQQVQAQAIAARAPAAAVNLPSFADLVDRVSPAVVSLEVVKGPDTTAPQMGDLPPELRRFFGGGAAPDADNAPEQVGGGSGFFISADGYIVTNHHVVDGANEITATLKDGRQLRARVIGSDERTDIAVIKVEGRGFPFVAFAPDARLRVGDWVVAIGNPFGLGGTATAGIVSATGRDIGGGRNISDFVQIDAPINPGNSGGPTFDMRGRVVGINTAIFSRSGGNDGIGFAIPAHIADRVTRQLMATGHVQYGWLGVSIQDLSQEMADSFSLPNSHGAIVGQVTAGSPAAQAGLTRGDVVLKVNGDPITNASDLTRRVGAATIGSSIQLDVLNSRGQRRNVSVRIAERPTDERLAEMARSNPSQATPAPNKPPTVVEPEIAPLLGMVLAPVSDGVRTQFGLSASDGGLEVRSVVPRSGSARRGIARGQVILEVDGEKVSTRDEFNTHLDAARRAGRTAVRLFVQAGQGATGYVALPLAE